MGESEKQRSRARRASSRRRRRRRLGRLLPVIVVVGIAYFYYRPLSSWMHTRDALAHRQAQVVALQKQKAELERSLTKATSLSALARRARRIGLVRQGEKLYIIKGIPAWKRAHQALDR